MEKPVEYSTGIRIEENTIIIAPSALHLDLYQEIVRQTGGCLNITVLTLEAYLSRHLSRERESQTVILYRYALALEDLPEENTFYTSKNDYDFLSECLNFMTLAKLYEIHDFPQESKREKDLLQIIERLMPIELWVDEARNATFEDAKDVRILTTLTSRTQSWWMDRLKSMGARELAAPQSRRKYYWTAGTPRKEMETAADALVANELKAETVLFALENPKEVYSLMQALDSRKIPYTLSSAQSTSRIIPQWKAVFVYLRNPSFENLLDLISALFRESYDLRRYLELYPDASSDLQGKEWQENALIDEKSFLDLQNLEIKISSWKPLLESMSRWDLSSLDEAGRLIMQQNPDPTQEDILAFQAVQDSFQQAAPFIHSCQDLDLFIRSLDELKVNIAPDEMKGALIGTKNMISTLRPNTFYIGADAEAFPGSCLMGGVFDETYMARLDFPSLEVRQEKQLEQMKRVCDQPENLYLLTPQADYEGNSVETSRELNAWLGSLPKFMRPAEPSISLRPSFQLQGVPSSDLYAPDDKQLVVHGRTLRDYEACPLKNLLRCSLDIRPPEQFREMIRPNNGVLIPAVMEKAMIKIGKPWNQLDRQEIGRLILDEFEFALSLFPARRQEIMDMAVELTDRMYWQFRLLGSMASACQFSFKPQVFSVNAEVESEEMKLLVEDKLTTTSHHRAAFNVYEPEAQYAPEGAFSPIGAMDLDLKIRAKEREAFKLSYSRGAAPVQMNESSDLQARAETIELFTRDSLQVQDLPEDRQGGLNDFVRKKIPTLEQQQEKMRNEAQKFASGIEKREFEPIHQKDACKHCPYKPICRNAAVERGNE